MIDRFQPAGTAGAQHVCYGEAHARPHARAADWHSGETEHGAACHDYRDRTHPIIIDVIMHMSSQDQVPAIETQT